LSISGRLLTVGSMAGSMGVYLPAMIFQKALGLARVLLFAYFLRGVPGEFGLWSLGLMIFSVLAPLVCLGSHLGLARYVSFYEARGRLRQFYRRAAWAVPACCGLLCLAALAAGGPITRGVISACQQPVDADFGRQLAICWAAIANAFALALYYNLLGFLGGMRLYRLISAVEIAFGTLFVAFACGAMAVRPSGLTLLLTHLFALVLALAGGMCFLHVAVRRTGTEGPGGPLTKAPSRGMAISAEDCRGETPLRHMGKMPMPHQADQPVEAGQPPAMPVALDLAADGEPLLALDGAAPEPGSRGGSPRVLRFALLALAGGELWVIANYISFFLTSQALKEIHGGVFNLYRQLAEPVAFLSAAAWTVVYGHVARRWEGGRRNEAVFNLQTAFKAVALGTMTLTVLLQAASPLWLQVLPERWRQGEGAALLPGLLLFYQMAGNLGLLNMSAWLLERPALTLMPPAAAVAVNLLLAAWWMPAHGSAGAAWAAGAGMAAGGGLSALACLLLSRLKLSASTYFLLLSPGLLLLAGLSPWAPPAAWGAVLLTALATDWILGRDQKAFLRSAARRAVGRSADAAPPR
jgi:O-antigen/teichoic acid export membrane protein